MRVVHVSHISTFSPTQCGIATFTEDLIRYQKGILPIRVRMAYGNEKYQPEFDSTIVIDNLETYNKAIKSINNSKTDVVSLQHEFGIYGGNYGEYVIRLAEEIKKPIVVTLHTVSAEMIIDKMKIIDCLCHLCKQVVVLTEEGKDILSTKLKIPSIKIKVIRHGIPNVNFVPPNSTIIRKNLETPLLFVSAGHLRPKKGYELALRALAKYNNLNPLKTEW